MELTDSTASEATRSPLGIDLNEIPSSSSAETLLDPVDVVRLHYETQGPPSLALAGLPVGDPSVECGTCGRPEEQGHVVVCDACERGFHIDCVGMHGPLATNFVEWVCGECATNGSKSKRWPLGVKSKRILDINASPPSEGDGDGDGEGRVELLDSRCTQGDAFGGNTIAAPVTYSNFVSARNGFALQKASGVLMHTVKVGLEDLLYHTQTTDRSIEELDWAFSLGRHRSSNKTANRLPSRNPSEIFLQALKDFISERHGVLEEGWHVEVRQSMSSYEVYAVYCSPDGKSFNSMPEVARYLGLVSKCNLKDMEMAIEEPFPQERSHLIKKRKSTRSFITNGFNECKESLVSCHNKELFFHDQNMENFPSKYGEVMEAGNGEDGSFGSRHTDDGFPVQFEDFFILSMGDVDVRPSYHGVNQIWPVGYRSCWHDKITGSLFLCEVLDGGDSGPLFKVKRCPCSVLPIPNGSTVLVRSKLDHSAVHNNEECYNLIHSVMDCDNDDRIQMVLLDPSPPSEDDILTCLRSSAKEMYAAESSGGLQPNDWETGVIEISVEECFPSAAWRLLSQRFIDACCDILKRNGTLMFHCNHVNNKLGSSKWGEQNEKSKATSTSLTKFCSSPESVNVPSKYEGDKELETLTNVLSKWLVNDRFGLDAEFVQEMIEQLPGVESCSKYKRLRVRDHSSTFPTVRNGVLVVQKMRGVEVKLEEVSNDIFRKSKRCRLAENHEIDDSLPPPGNVLCVRLPPVLVGELYQAWELFLRFHEILGLKRPFSLEELEDELIFPWSDGSDIENPERKIWGNQVLTSHIDGTGGQISSSSSESTGVSVDNPNVFIEMETEASKGAAQDKLASVTYSRCCGVALTKAHFSLLDVLISELQSKVAALVDPNFDTGESKSKRGRKKDVDMSIWERRTKLNMLPINELTWPELARRYILAVLSMEGNLDSVDITARESGKVFRCLQGDGGVLCGSLTGVAGMETDALLLAEAIKKIFGSLNRENNILAIEDEGSEPTGPCEKNIGSDGNIPEWAQVLEPVRKLPTNVGTRIRKCVYEALEKCPPEWAKKVLEHSISKEVYKGNASGPTKKAVLSVLADVRNETPSQISNKGCKRKRSFSVSDIIMRKCRIILRHAAAADDEKVFCTLLGKKLVISSDNDDEGILGSPAMVSRPLDFRTIDLRLAVGAYGGSHEAFLEDVHELWNNIHTAFRDQPDMVELAEKLSQNFEVLFENEVVTFVEKILGYAKSECLSAVDKKEIDDLLASINDIPKAPWDEGVCKVCGIDKDDDSVLLCDKCDAEYHTYCLNPPLSRIPEGNWYCPSCVSGVRVVQEASEGVQATSQCGVKKDQGTFTHVFLDTLTHLAAVMKENEYWEFSVDERTFLLKFLCDESLNSTLIRQHLEQCAETTAELQQKLRSFSIEWRNLKSREEFMAARAAKVETNAVGEIGSKDGIASASTNNDKCMGQLPNLAGKLSNLPGVSDEVPTLDGGPKEIGFNGFGKHPSVTNSEKNRSCNGQFMDSIDNEVRSEDVHEAANDSRLPSQRHDKSFKPNELPLSSSLSQEADCLGKICFQGDLHEGKGTCGSLQPSADHQGCFLQREQKAYAAEDASSVTMNEPQGYHLELSTAKNDLLLLQNSIVNVESQLLKLSVRREFFGADSSGRLYWASAISDGNPQLIVDGSLVEQQRRKVLDLEDMVNGGSVLQNSTSADPCLKWEGSKASCSFLNDADDILTACSAWVCYQTDAEIEALINWLKDTDQKERELKESILQWQKSKFREMRQAESKNVDNHAGFPIPVDRDGTSCNRLVTKAALVLEKKYGPCFEFDANETIKKRRKRARTICEDTMYRCECLEPIWPSRYHCLLCHWTFSTAVDLEGHSDGRCLSGALSAHEKSKELIDSFKGKGNLTPTSPEDCISGMDLPKASGNSCSELSSRLIKFQNEGLVSPFDFDKIRTKFVTKDSNKELVQDIGLISSNGIPLFVPCVSPYLTDSTMMLIAPPKDKIISGDEFNPNERLIFSERNRNSNGGHQPILGNSSKKFSSSEISDVLKTNKSVLQCSEQRNRQLSLNACVPEVGVSRCVIPQSSLRPLVGKVSQILRRLKINLLDMEAALPEEALRPSKAQLERRWAWRAFVKSSQAIYEIVQASIVLEDMIKTDYLRNDWWYWSSLSAAVKTSTISSLALRIYSLDAAIVYDKASPTLASTENLNSSSISDQNPLLGLDTGDKCKVSRKSNKKRKEPEG